MKKKIFSIALVACLVVLSIAGASVAYFTDTEVATNVFTAGNVDISLAYKGEVANESLVEIRSDNVYPSQEFNIDATITNTGSEKAYVGAVISLTKNAEFKTIVTPDGANDTVAISEFLVGLAPTGFVTKTIETANGYEVYLLYTVELEAGDNPVVLFEDVLIPAAWNNEEMAIFSDFKLDVKAYATQSAGFDDAAAAFKAAFGATSDASWYVYFN